jgi:hypothetical protein
MATIPQISESMQRILGPMADELGWQTTFNQREGKLSGSAFVQALVFSVLENGELTYTRLCSGAQDAGVTISNQGLAQRFGPASAALLEGVLKAVVAQIIDSQPAALPLLKRFQGVYLRDSSVISLPSELAAVWAGVGGSSGTTAALKLHTRLEISGGQLAGPCLSCARQADSRASYQTEALPAGAVRFGDLAYFSLRQFARDQQAGVFWFSRFKVGTRVYDEQGQPIDVLAWLRSQSQAQFERTVYLGKRQRLPCRLLVEHVPPEVIAQRYQRIQEYARKKQVDPSAELLALAEWTLLITNIPLELLSIPEALVLLRVRWQMELLFRLWKSFLRVDEWRSSQPWRILTELYAKLVAAVLLHWLLLVELWQIPNRSIWKAALMVRHLATHLALAFRDPIAFQVALIHLQTYFCQLCHLNPRRSRPNTYQLLSDPPCTTLA